MGTRRPLAIHWSVSSVNYLEQATGYIEEDSPQGASLIRRKILRSVKRLADMPFAGRIGRIDGTRELVILRTGYIVVHRVSSSAVEVLSIWQGSRQWPISRNEPGELHS